MKVLCRYSLKISNEKVVLQLISHDENTMIANVHSQHPQNVKGDCL